MIKGYAFGKMMEYDGEVQSIGTYPNFRNRKFKVWIGKTEYGIIYISYSDDPEYHDDIISYTADINNPDPCLRFYDTADEITFDSNMKIPERLQGYVAARAQQLKEEQGLHSNIKGSEEAKRILHLI